MGILDGIVPDRLRVGFNRSFNPERGIILVANNTGIFERSAILIEAFEAGGIAPSYQLSKFRGTATAPANVAQDDRVGIIEWDSYSNVSSYCAGIEVAIDAAVVAGQRTATRMLFQTALNNAAPANNMALFSNGFLVLGASKVARGVAEANGILDVAGNATVEVYLERASTDGSGSLIICRKSRGTLAAPAIVAQYDDLGGMRVQAYTNAWHTDLAAMKFWVAQAVVAGQAPATTITFKVNKNNTAAIEPIRISAGAASSGSLLVGTGAYDDANTIHVAGTRAGSIARFDNFNGGGSANLIYMNGGDNAVTGSKFLEFARPDFTVIGSVVQNAAGTVIYNITSDECLKADIKDSGIGLSELMRVRVRQFRYKSDPSNQLTQGFIAQELHKVFPDAVSVGVQAKDCDCVLDDPEAPGHDLDCCHRNPWGVDYGRVTPLLVRAIQDLAVRVAAMDGKGL